MAASVPSRNPQSPYHPMTPSPSLHGYLVIDKPAGWTSFDVVARARRVLGEKRIGHAGTLDPAATGVLPLAVGVATKTLEFLTDASKIGGQKLYELARRGEEIARPPRPVTFYTLELCAWNPPVATILIDSSKG